MHFNIMNLKINDMLNYFVLKELDINKLCAYF